MDSQQVCLNTASYVIELVFRAERTPQYVTSGETVCKVFLMWQKIHETAHEGTMNECRLVQLRRASV